MWVLRGIQCEVLLGSWCSIAASQCECVDYERETSVDSALKLAEGSTAAERELAVTSAAVGGVRPAVVVDVKYVVVVAAAAS